MDLKMWNIGLAVLILAACSPSTQGGKQTEKTLKSYRIEVEVLNPSAGMYYGIAMQTSEGVTFFDAVLQKDVQTHQYSVDLKAKNAIFTTSQPASFVRVALVAPKGKNPRETLCLSVYADGEQVFQESIQTRKEKNVLKYVEPEQ